MSAARVLSLGAGVQSTAVLLLSEEGRIPAFDAAIFADTGWEPKAVYDHLDRLDAATSTEIRRVTSGNIRADALDPDHRFASMPMYVKNADGGDGMGRRQCTSEYKLKPIKAEVRRILGYPHPTPVPKGVWVEQAIGISVDEIGRAGASDVNYARHVFPLLDLGWDRKECVRYLDARGWQFTPKSACIGCPFHGNRQWRKLRDETPAEWADAVDFDASIRHGSAQANAQGQPLRGEMFLHRSRVPLDQAPIDHITAHEWHARQGSFLDMAADARWDADEDGDPDGCGPFTCRSGEPVVDLGESA